MSLKYKNMEKKDLKNNVFSLKANIDEESGKSLNDGEVFDIPIGALASFEIVVYVNRHRVPVTSSSWTVLGKQIVGGTVVQTLNAGLGQTQNNPVIPGGYGGDPAKIATSWVQGGKFAVIIQGTYVYKGIPRKFTAAGTVIVHAPGFDDAGAYPDISHGTMDHDRLSLTYSTDEVAYFCDNVVFGGQIGFLQTVNGFRLRGRERNNPTQMMGANQSFVDNSGTELFYYSTKAAQEGVLKTNDTPSQVCDGEPDYNWYKIGGTGDSLERYSMFLAYKAPITPGIIESYILVKDVCNWYWTSEGIFEDDQWGTDPSTTREDCSKWIVNDWALPIWVNNSEDIMHWMPYHQE